MSDSDQNMNENDNNDDTASQTSQVTQDGADTAAQIAILQEQMALMMSRLEAAGTAAVEAESRATAAEKDAAESRKALKQARRNTSIGGILRYADDLHDGSGSGSDSGDDEDEDEQSKVEDRVAKKVKSMLAQVEKHSGEKSDHRKYIDDIRTAFENGGMKHIVSTNQAKWEDLKVSNSLSARIQNKVMLSVLQTTIHKGAAYTKYREAKRKNSRDSRILFLAVRTAYHASTDKLTKKRLKVELGDMKWSADKDYDKWVQKVLDKCEEFEDLQDAKTGKSLAMEEEDKCDSITEKLIASDKEVPLEEQMNWQDIFDQATLTFNSVGEDFTLDDLHTLVRPKLEAAKANKKSGKVQEQKAAPCTYCGIPYHTEEQCRKKKGDEGRGRGRGGGGQGGRGGARGGGGGGRSRGSGFRGKCWNCDEYGHTKNECPKPPKEPKEEGHQNKATTPASNTQPDPQQDQLDQFEQFQEFREFMKIKKGRSDQHTADPWHIGVPDSAGILSGRGCAHLGTISDTTTAASAGTGAGTTATSNGTDEWWDSTEIHEFHADVERNRAKYEQEAAEREAVRLELDRKLEEMQTDNSLANCMKPKSKSKSGGKGRGTGRKRNVNYKRFPATKGSISPHSLHDLVSHTGHEQMLTFLKKNDDIASDEELTSQHALADDLDLDLDEIDLGDIDLDDGGLDLDEIDLGDLDDDLDLGDLDVDLDDDDVGDGDLEDSIESEDEDEDGGEDHGNDSAVTEGSPSLVVC